MMTWKKLTLTGSAALVAMVAPVALAQSADRHVAPRGGSGGGVSQMRALSSSSSAMAQAGRSSGFRGGDRGGQWRGGGDRGGQWRGGNRSGQWRGGDRGNWRHSGNRNWHHRRHYYPRRYYSYYPYFGYPYGYGYPYWGASASLYYNGYQPVYYSNGGSIVAEVQQQLAEAGYYRGAIDGVIGPRTRAAIRAFERDNGLGVDGRIDNRLLARMGIR